MESWHLLGDLEEQAYFHRIRTQLLTCDKTKQIINQSWVLSAVLQLTVEQMTSGSANLRFIIICKSWYKGIILFYILCLLRYMQYPCKIVVLNAKKLIFLTIPMLEKFSCIHIILAIVSCMTTTWVPWFGWWSPPPPPCTPWVGSRTGSSCIQYGSSMSHHPLHIWIR